MTTIRERSGLWQSRALIWNFAQRDLKARFKGTALGWAWSLVVPLATLIIYTVVFSIIFRFQPEEFGNGRPGNFAVWLLAGLVPWGMFATSLNTAIGSLLATGPLLKKIYFPSYAPVIGATLAVVTQSLIELGILLVVLALFGNVSWTWVLVVPWAFIFIVFIGAICHAVAVLNVYFRDLQHIVSVAIQMLFYLTPILYRLTDIPQEWHGIRIDLVIGANPLTQFIDVFRDLTYSLTPGFASSWLLCLLSAVVAVVFAVVVHRKRGQDLSEEL